jgi:hypothetical protein
LRTSRSCRRTSRPWRCTKRGSPPHAREPTPERTTRQLTSHAMRVDIPRRRATRVGYRRCTSRPPRGAPRESANGAARVDLSGAPSHESATGAFEPTIQGRAIRQSAPGDARVDRLRCMSRVVCRGCASRLFKVGNTNRLLRWRDPTAQGARHTSRLWRCASRLSRGTQQRVGCRSVRADLPGPPAIRHWLLASRDPPVGH